MAGVDIRINCVIGGVKMNTFLESDYSELKVGFGGGALWQLANRSASQMMSYLIETPEGKTVMIDGGFPDERNVQHLLEMLHLHNDRVDFWFITHAHGDHFGCLHMILQMGITESIKIGMLCFSFPPEEWLCTREPHRAQAVRSFLREIERSKIPVRTLRQGEVIFCGGMEFEILRDSSAYSSYHNINDTSVVMLAKFPRRAVLFLGDLGEKAGQDFLAVTDTSKLRCDIVQMAHHGQSGVGQSFYEVVHPKICLYPAPEWLWNCDDGRGRGTDANLRTLETRRWMEELEIEYSCVAADGDYLLR